MPTLTSSDVIAILAIVSGVLGTLGAGILADRRTDSSAKADRLRQARLRQIEDTQRYVMAMLEFISSVGLLGMEKAGSPPNLGDYPKVTLSLLGESDVVMTFLNYLESEAPRIAADGPRWQKEDQDRYEAVGIIVTERFGLKKSACYRAMNQSSRPATRRSERPPSCWAEGPRSATGDQP